MVITVTSLAKVDRSSNLLNTRPRLLRSPDWATAEARNRASEAPKLEANVENTMMIVVKRYYSNSNGDLAQFTRHQRAVARQHCLFLTAHRW